MIYLDNAATSFPKPEEVVDAVWDYMVSVGANPGRSGHYLAVNAARIVFKTREGLASLFGISDSRRIVFTSNATEALNTVIYGHLQEGDHVITTSLEHNAVSRPLRFLEERKGLGVTVLDSDSQGRMDPGAFKRAITGRTRLVIVNHASNVLGTLLPLKEVRDAIGEIPLLVDSAQTAGTVEIDVEADGIDFLAFTGHKSLLGPQGTGGLFIRPGLDMEPLMRGGTGSSSNCDIQPEVLPDRYESGTMNGAGIAGLGAGVEYILEIGSHQIREDEMALFSRLWEGLKSIPKVTLYGLENPEERVATVSFNISGMASSEVGSILGRHYEILVRTGLHCAPWAHRVMGTIKGGTVRIGIGALNTSDDIDAAIEAVRGIAQ